MKPLGHAIAGLGLALLAAGVGSAVWAPEGARSVAATVLPLGAFLVLTVGMARRLWIWARSPVPYRIPTTAGQQRSLAWLTPGRLESPATASGVVARMALEGLAFRSLFRNARGEIRPDFRIVHREQKGLWLGALAFHVSLGAIFVRHLRLVFEPSPWAAAWVASVDGFFRVGTPALYASDLVLCVAIVYLAARRLFDPPLRYVSLAADYLPLGLIGGLAATGLLMRHLWGADVVAVKAWVMGLASLRFDAPPPAGLLIGAHVAMAAALAGMVPFGKLSHAAGAWLSPTRNLANTSRARRHVNPWQTRGASRSYAAWEAEFHDRMKSAGLPLDPEAR